MATIELYNGNCLTELQKIADNSIDSVVTDPPYELGFMGKAWDASGIAFNVNVWKECLRVLKPGGHILAFGGTRTYHRMTVAIEDAGFEIRDCIAWMYGSGFPKSHNIGKAVDKIEGNVRTVVGENLNKKGRKSDGKGSFVSDTLLGKGENAGVNVDKGNSEWEGWGTALKPAFEPVVMGRKPIEGTVANNVLTHGVGGLNIDGCRIATDDSLTRKIEPATNKIYGKYKTFGQEIQPEGGRFPANIILDEEAGRILDEQSGTTKSIKRGTNYNKEYDTTNSITGFTPPTTAYSDNNTYADSGGASRFFYCPKASKKDRNEGCDALEEKMSAHSVADKCAKCGKFLGASANVCKCEEPERVGISNKNFHPTVKPTTLMEYLIKLVTPKGGKVLDPFMGSGSTGKGAVLNDYSFVGIELSPEYFAIAESRIKSVENKTKFWC